MSGVWRIVTALLVCGIFFGFEPERSFGTACGPQPPCGVVSPGIVVFVGEFITPGSESAWGEEEHLAVFRVIESFNGLAEDQRFVFIQGLKPWPENPFGYWLITAVEDNQGGPLRIDIWGNVGPVGSRRAELDYLRKRQRGETTTKIFGKVSVALKPLPGVKVLATTRDQTLSTVTSQEGNFQFDGLSAGEYLVRLDHEQTRAAGYRAATPDFYYGHLDRPDDPGWRSDERSLRVADRACKEVFLHLHHDGRLSGTLATEDGKPLANTDVRISGSTGTTSRVVPTDSKGQFHFIGLDPGEVKLYVLYMTWVQPVRSDLLYFPGTTDEADATVISIGPRSAVKNIRFVVPKQFESRIAPAIGR